MVKATATSSGDTKQKKPKSRRRHTEEDIMNSDKVTVDRRQLLTVLVQLENIQAEIKELKKQIRG